MQPNYLYCVKKWRSRTSFLFSPLYHLATYLSTWRAVILICLCMYLFIMNTLLTNPTAIPVLKSQLNDSILLFANRALALIILFERKYTKFHYWSMCWVYSAWFKQRLVLIIICTVGHKNLSRDSIVNNKQGSNFSTWAIIRVELVCHTLW